MGEEVRRVSETPALSAEESERDASIGRYLAGQRRLRGVSLDDLAAATKIPRRSLERLESGAFDRTADGFARGFVRTVASALGLDPDETVNRLLTEPLDADDEGPLFGRELVRVAAVGLGVALLVVAALAWRALRAGPEAGEASPPSEVVLRRDPVRALAEAHPPGTEPLPSGGERPDDRGADPAVGGLR